MRPGSPTEGLPFRNALGSEAYADQALGFSVCAIGEGFAELIAHCLSNLPVASVIRTELTLIKIKRAPLRKGPWM
jgi:hypothetical protein